MKGLSMRLMQLMLLSLGLKDDCTTLIQDPNELTGAVRLNSYPACPDPDRAMGMAAHSDSSLVTILYQNSTPGLQVLRPSNGSGPAMATATASTGSLIVILGTLLHILTETDAFKALHIRACAWSNTKSFGAYLWAGEAKCRRCPTLLLAQPKAQFIGE
ncbi:uncharacterized protein A4U43_C08F6540 [Asparagus officinalis]|nr:uncharacterized protein A4U43_C08F6540 [Asparagus officinalis]